MERKIYSIFNGEGIFCTLFVCACALSSAISLVVKVNLVINCWRRRVLSRLGSKSITQAAKKSMVIFIRNYSFYLLLLYLSIILFEYFKDLCFFSLRSVILFDDKGNHKCFLFQGLYYMNKSIFIVLGPHWL